MTNDVHADCLFYRLFDEAERVRWHMSEVPWSDIDPAEVSPAWRAVARETMVGELTTFSATQRFFTDFGDDLDFTQWLTIWLYEETKHPSAILGWLDVLGETFDSAFMLQGRETLPFMPSKMGTLATNIISEMVAATLYVTLSRQPGCEPVLAQICRQIGGDEARHAASFYSYARRRLERADDPKAETIAALKVLYFWTTPELNGRVGHPVNLLAKRYQTLPELHEAVPREAVSSAVASTYRRVCRVFETLLDVELRELRDVGDQLEALQFS